MSSRLHAMRRVVLGIVGTLFLVQTTGCYSWQVTSMPKPDRQVNALTEYELSTVDQRTLKLTGLHLRNDSVFGVPNIPGTPEVGVPTSQITKVRVRKVDASATFGVVALVAVVVGAFAAAATLGDFGSGWGGSSSGFLGDGTNLSCPLVYSWDGQAYRLDSGTFGGAITPALARTDLDNLVYPRPAHGVLHFLLTDEANETEHVDAFTVVAIDHSVGTEVAPDARANGSVHLLRDMAPPLAARDLMGRDALAQVSAMDGWSWESRIDGRDPGNPAHLRDGLELRFARPRGHQALLVLDAQNTPWAAQLMGVMVSAFGRETAKWYAAATTAAASLPISRAQHEEGFLAASIWDGASWRPAGEVWEAGPEVAKRQVLPIALDGISGDTLRIRLESAPSFWQIDAARLAPETMATARAVDLPIISADAPRTPRASVLLSRRDGVVLDMERGDTVRLSVRDTLPRPSSGMVRSYLARTSGWYRIHGRDDGEPDIALLSALGRSPHGGARISVTRLNEALALLDREARHAPSR